MKQLIIACMLLLSPFYALSQSNYHAGSVILKTNQTLTGYIDYREWEENPKTISFKNNITDKNAQILYPANVKSFIVDGFENYISYNLKISLNKTVFPNLDIGADTTTITGDFFLKPVITDKNVSLYSYADSIKTRLFVQEQQAMPFELSYQQYYAEDRTHIISETRFIGQLYYLANKYVPQNTSLVSKIKRLAYNSGDIAAMVNIINGNSSKLQPVMAINKSAQPIRYFIGTGFNVSQTGFDGLNQFTGAKKTQITPKVSAGLDIFNNPNVQQFIFRVEVALSYLSPRLESNASANTGLNYKQYYTYNQYNASLIPQFIFNIYNKDSFKVYVGAGASLNFSTYSNNTNIIKTDYYTNNQTPYELEHIWLNFPLQTGVVINKKIELFASYTPAAPYTKYAYFSLSSTLYSAGIHYLFKQKVR